MRITDGVSVHLLGGHTPGTQVVLLDTEAGRVCIPGDLVPFYKNLELNWPMGAFFDLQGVCERVHLDAIERRHHRAAPRLGLLRSPPGRLHRRRRRRSWRGAPGVAA